MITRLKEFIFSIEVSLAIAWVILVKACIVNPSLADAIFFICAIANVCHIRFVQAAELERHEKLLDQNLIMIQNQIDRIEAEQKIASKSAEEARKLIADFKLANTFQRRDRQ